ncbi:MULTISPECIES: type III-B CRISPR module-associated Cmr3 family protein [unclassified Microcoleus]|uniref:type III-B CRISPR module-associated Cmr3 family protein n=1 Tax=unclassified Microcoleus TaxID=2642155 RepID=UPI002FD494D3
MKAITFLLHTQQPILATSLQGDPNSDVSHSYIPGSMIRGMLINRYLRPPHIQELDILDQKIRKLFFDGQTRYLNAYLCDREKEQRTLPVPLCLYKKKGEDPTTEIYNFIPLASEHRPDSLKRLDDKFCIIDEYGDISLYKESRRINIHNQRSRKKGRGTDSSGAVFRYDAIDAGQVFQAVILCDDKEDFDAIKLLLTPTNHEEIINAWLGGSQSAGYGHVTVDLLPDDDDWTEVKIDWEERSQHQNNLTVTLLSDTIIRDECGQSTTNPKQFAQLISEALGTELKHIDTYASSLNVGGFNRKWGLPLPQVPALAAGSVFVFERRQNLDSQQVTDLEAQGIGERRVDGFGRVILNWLKEEGEITANSVNTEPDTSQILSSTKANEIAAQMAERLLRQKLDELLLQQVEPNTPESSREIKNSQLSRLMNITRKALTEGKPDPLYELLGRDEGTDNLTKTARTQFQQTKMRNGKKLDEKIREWLNNPDSWILSSWGSRPKVDNLPGIKVATQQKTLDAQLSLEYTLRLIMAVAKKMMKDKNND